jgi:hypothetical protein
MRLVIAAETSMMAAYAAHMFRADRLLAWSRRVESERRLANKIRESFGTDGKTPVLLKGSWGRRPNLRNQAPTPGIGLARRLVEEHGIQIYEVCEKWSSSVCPGCDGDVCEHGTHRILRCTGACHRFWDRDVLGAKNIMRNGLHLLRHHQHMAIFA